MKLSIAGVFMCSAIIGVMALTSAATAKTAKECRTEWIANKAANQAKGITEKAYVDGCKSGGAAEAPKATPATAKEKEKTTAKEKVSTKTASPAGAEKKTVKECEAEWRADKTANQAKGITEKAYVADCRAGTAAATKPAAAPAAPTPTETKMTPPASESKQTKMAPAAAPTTAETRTEAAPLTGKPSGANQFAAEGQAKAHCPTGLVVWANLNSKIYHFAGHNDYGHTKQGAYMCEKDAMGEGMRAAKNEKHP